MPSLDNLHSHCRNRDSAPDLGSILRLEWGDRVHIHWHSLAFDHSHDLALAVQRMGMAGCPNRRGRLE